MSEGTTTQTPTTGATNPATLLGTPPAAATSTAPTGAGATTTTSAPAATTEDMPEWMKTLPEEIRLDPSLKPIKDITSLAKSYVHAQQMVGKDKVIIPGKNASEQEWNQLYQKLGLPESVDKYEVPEPTGAQKEFFAEFKKAALEAKILPTQAKKLLDWYENANKTAIQSMQSKAVEERKAGIDSLRKEWGDAFEREVNVARIALKEFGDEGLTKFLESTGMGDHPAMVKLMNKIGKSLAEDKIKGVGESNRFTMTPDEAQGKINQIMSDFNHPYHKAGHADHDRAVAEVNKLFEIRMANRSA